MSNTGIPSVTHTINGVLASAASIIASAAPDGGTKTKDAFAPVAAIASATVSKKGMDFFSWRNHHFNFRHFGKLKSKFRHGKIIFFV